ncbi:hypothetical protein BsWGS_25549 [Bradybaena similaris]
MGRLGNKTESQEHGQIRK